MAAFKVVREKREGNGKGGHAKWFKRLGECGDGNEGGVQVFQPGTRSGGVGDCGVQSAVLVIIENIERHEVHLLPKLRLLLLKHLLVFR